jgi:hypothetical protein
MIDATLQRRQFENLKNHFPGKAKLFDQIAEKRNSEAAYQEIKRDAEEKQAAQVAHRPIRLDPLPQEIEQA